MKFGTLVGMPNRAGFKILKTVPEPKVESLYYFIFKRYEKFILKNRTKNKVTFHISNMKLEKLNKIIIFILYGNIDYYILGIVSYLLYRTYLQKYIRSTWDFNQLDDVRFLITNFFFKYFPKEIFNFFYIFEKMFPNTRLNKFHIFIPKYLNFSSKKRESKLKIPIFGNCEYLLRNPIHELIKIYM